MSNNFIKGYYSFFLTLQYLFLLVRKSKEWTISLSEILFIPVTKQWQLTLLFCSKNIKHFQFGFLMFLLHDICNLLNDFRIFISNIRFFFYIIFQVK